YHLNTSLGYAGDLVVLDFHFEDKWTTSVICVPGRRNLQCNKGRGGILFVRLGSQPVSLVNRQKLVQLRLFCFTKRIPGCLRVQKGRPRQWPWGKNHRVVFSARLGVQGQPVIVLAGVGWE